jgi:hypothetical protein
MILSLNKCRVLPLLYTLCFSSIAYGQEDFEPGKIDLAKVYMEEGQEHYLAERYNEAAISFMKAYSVVPLSAFLFNTAVSYEKIKMYKHAAEFFERKKFSTELTSAKRKPKPKVRMSRPSRFPSSWRKSNAARRGSRPARRSPSSTRALRAR